MTDKFHNKYRIPSARMQNWNYKWAGAYFITICTQNREHYFGEIKNGKMQLSPIGVIADIMWYEIKNHTQNTKLDAFVVMPNHIHGILILNGNDTDDMKNMDGMIMVENAENQNNVENVETGRKDVETGRKDVETGHALSLRLNQSGQPVQPMNHTTPISSIHPIISKKIIQSNNPIIPDDQNTIGQKRFQNIGNNSISSIIGSYKSAVTKHAHRLGFDFGWQTRFHDHIIRDHESFDKIQKYIMENVLKWEEDKFYIS